MPFPRQMNNIHGLEWSVTSFKRILRLLSCSIHKMARVRCNGKDPSLLLLYGAKRVMLLPTKFN